MRGKRSTGIVLLIAAGLLTGFRTDALRPSWKYAGGALPGNESGREIAFYDADTIRYLDSGDVQVWVKTADAAVLDGLIERDTEIVSRAAEKTAKAYYPPYVLTDPDPDGGADAYLDVILWEEAANHPGLTTRSKGLYEIRCPGKMIRRISSILYRADGTATYVSDFDRWSPITPGSAGDTLHKILCR